MKHGNILQAPLAVLPTTYGSDAATLDDAFELATETFEYLLVAHPNKTICNKLIAEQDYFIGGSIGTDQRTIYLGKPLPFSSTPLIIKYQSTDNGNPIFDFQYSILQILEIGGGGRI